MRLLAIATLTLLTGCASQHQQSVRACTALGFGPGTDEFFNCYQETLNPHNALGSALLHTTGDAQWQR